jgi:hypothetical protein
LPHLLEDAIHALGATPVDCALITATEEGIDTARGIGAPNDRLRHHASHRRTPRSRRSRNHDPEPRRPHPQTPRTPVAELSRSPASRRRRFAPPRPPHSTGRAALGADPVRRGEPGIRAGSLDSAPHLGSGAVAAVPR